LAEWKTPPPGATAPQKMILLSMILSKKPLHRKPVLKSQKGNRLKPGSNIFKI
jgi:hypothetical protein